MGDRAQESSEESAETAAHRLPEQPSTQSVRGPVHRITPELKNCGADIDTIQEPREATRCRRTQVDYKKPRSHDPQIDPKPRTHHGKHKITSKTQEIRDGSQFLDSHRQRITNLPRKPIQQ